MKIEIREINCFVIASYPTADCPSILYVCTCFHSDLSCLPDTPFTIVKRDQETRIMELINETTAA